MSTVGDRVRIARIDAGLSQDQLAKKVGMRQPTLSRLEGGGSTTTKKLSRIAEVTGFELDWLEMNVGPAKKAQKKAKTQEFEAFPDTVQDELLLIGRALRNR